MCINLFLLQMIFDFSYVCMYNESCKKAEAPKKHLLLLEINTYSIFLVPLKKIDIEVSIQGFIANVRSDLHYINDSDENLETKFLFPLDSDSAVYKFEAEIDGRTIVAEVQEKSQVPIQSSYITNISLLMLNKTTVIFINNAEIRYIFYQT